MNRCGDNRFDVIDKAKKDILSSTNIDTDKDEMKVLDNFLFRCWQMGWLVKYDDNKENVFNATMKLIDNLAYLNACHQCQYYEINKCTNKDTCAWTDLKKELKRIIKGEQENGK